MPFFLPLQPLPWDHSRCCAIPTPTRQQTQRQPASTLKTGVLAVHCLQQVYPTRTPRREYNRRVKEVVERSWADVD